MNKGIKSKSNNKKKSKLSIAIKFIVLLIVSLVVGYGAATIVLDDKYDIPAMFESVFNWISANAFLFANVMWLLILGAIILVIVSKKKYKLLENEVDEEMQDEMRDKIDFILSITLNLISVFTIFNFVLFGIAFCGFKESDYFIKHLILFALGFVAIMIIQNIAINIMKKLNPEKKGNILDTKFHEDWYESCDEMEREQIGKASYSSMQKTSGIIVTMLVITIFLSIVTSISIWTPICIGIIWLVQNQSYLNVCYKLSKKKRSACDND